MNDKKNAPQFAAKLSALIEERSKTQRQMARECSLSSSAMNRLCKHGVGTDDDVCLILKQFNLKRRRVLEMLADRRAELSHGAAREFWEGFRYAFLNEDQYLRELSPFPLERAYACTHLGIHIGDVVALAQSCGLSQIEDSGEINFKKLMAFIQAFEQRFGKEARDAVLSDKCDLFPPVLLFDFAEQVNVADYLDLTDCGGRLLFGLPHLIIGDYEFGENGEIKAHKNTGGVEFLFSLAGVFELTYEGIVYGTKLSAGRFIFLLDARKKHAIKLIEAKEKKGRLLMVRFYPGLREVKPGRPRRNRVS